MVQFEEDLTVEEVARFYSYIVPGETPDDCALWRGGLDSQGYGQFSYHGVHVRAHCFMHMLTSGCLLPRGMVIMRSCNNKLCCNPRHFVTGTRSEVMRKIGKYYFLSNKPRNRGPIPSAVVRHIRAAYDQPRVRVSDKDAWEFLAYMNGLAVLTVKRICQRKTYKWVEEV